MPFSTDDPSAQELLARNAQFDNPEQMAMNLRAYAASQQQNPNPTNANAPTYGAPPSTAMAPPTGIPVEQQAQQPGGIKGMFARMLANMSDAAMKESTGMNSAERQLAQAQIEHTRAVTNQMGQMVTLPNGVSMPYGVALKVFPALLTGQSRENVAGVNANSREKVAGIKADSSETIANANAQNHIDVEKLRQQGPLQMAQARAANAHADLQEAMNDPDSPAFKLALQKVQWANYYKQAALEMQKSRLDFQQNGPTANIRTQGQMAGALQDHVSDIKGEIASLGSAGKLGPLQGRFNEFMAGKYGAGDPDYVALRTDLGLFQTALMKAHVGARGSEQIMAHFKGLIDSGKASPESLEAAMTTINKYLTSYVKAGQFTPSGGGNAPPPGAKVRDFSHLVK